MGDDETVFSDVDVVSDLDEVVDFCAFADDGSSESGAVDGGICPDFHVVFDDDNAALGDFGVLTVNFFETEPVTTDDGSGVKDNAVSDFAAVEER